MSSTDQIEPGPTQTDPERATAESPTGERQRAEAGTDEADRPPSRQLDATGGHPPTPTPEGSPPPDGGPVPDRTRSFWWFAASGVVGVVLVTFALLDVSRIANVIGFMLGVLAHGGVAIFIIGAKREISGKGAKREISGKRRRPGPIVLWVSATLGLGFVVYKVDELVLRTLPISVWWEALFIALSLAVIVTLAVVDRRSYNLAPKVLHAVAGLSLGIALPVIALGFLAYSRQRDMDDQRPVIPTISRLAGVYVALGDSYSAGEGLTPFQPGSTPGCHRSPFAYPVLLKFDDPTVRREFRACSGAVTHDVDLGIIGGHAAQVDTSVARRDVSLVTLTVGGNDVVFSGVVQSCFIYENCIGEDFVPPSTSPARPTINYPKRQAFDSWAAEAMDLLDTNLERVYTNVANTYPDARIVVIGYPYLFPDGPAPWSQRDCRVVLSRVDSDERRRLRELTDQLNARMYKLALAKGMEFVSPAAAWDGHEPCSDKGQYTNAILPILRLTKPIDGGSFHPNKRGQEELARLVACYLNSNPERPTTVASTPPGSLGAPIGCA